MLLTSTNTASYDFRKVGPALASLLAAVLAPLVIYLSTTQSIVDIWNSSETFAHGYFILPISAWLIWRRRDTLPLDEMRPCWPALLLLAGCGFGWLLADLAEVQVVRQYAMVSMIPAAALALLGPQLARAMAFPLLFLLLAVPFGEVFVAPLIDFTADFTVAALRLTGIPVLHIGNHFEIPTGRWSVVEACSGVRYLIASVTLGLLYAYLTYRSLWRRALFILAAIIVPIIANGLRAYMIVMIGHLSGMELATGVDHIIYGWLFFGVIMFAMLWIGSFWREDEADTKAYALSARSSATAPNPASATSALRAALVAIACLAVWPIYAHYMDEAVFNPDTAQLDGFDGNWRQGPPFTDWKPHFLPANAEFQRFFQQDGQSAGLSILYYRNQGNGSKLISSSNRMVHEKNRNWIVAGTSARGETFSGEQINLQETRLRGASGHVLAWNWYWISGEFTSNPYLAKLLQAKAKLLMQGDDGAAITVFAPYSQDPEEARTAMRRFLASHLVPLEAVLTSNAKR